MLEFVEKYAIIFIRIYFLKEKGGYYAGYYVDR